jgi:hypothetical protein
MVARAQLVASLVANPKTYERVMVTVISLA